MKFQTTIGCVFTAFFLATACTIEGDPETIGGSEHELAASAGAGAILRNARPVADRYIVVLDRDRKKGCGGSVEALAKAIASRHEGRILHVYQSALCGFAIQLPEARARRLVQEDGVAFVEEDGEITGDTVQSSPPWGLDRIDQRNLPLSNTYSYDTTGSNVNIYVLDTGIRTTHNEFGGRAYGSFTSIIDNWGTSDCHGHGTHVAGIAAGATYGVAKGARVYSVRVLNCSGNGTFSEVIAGVDWVTTYAVAGSIVNMSLSGGGNTALDTAITNSINDGHTYVVAAGNAGLNACNYSPARVPAAITVAATDRNDRRPAWSNIGSCIDLFAPGVDILSAWNTSDSATSTQMGTSMAAPHVAGAAARYRETHPTATPAQIAQALINEATTGVVQSPGAGSPNRLLYVAPPCTPITECPQWACETTIDDGCGGELECGPCEVTCGPFQDDCGGICCPRVTNCGCALE